MKWILIFYLIVDTGNSGHSQQTQLEFNTEAQCAAALVKLSAMPAKFYTGETTLGKRQIWGRSTTYGVCIKADLKK